MMRRRSPSRTLRRAARATAVWLLAAVLWLLCPGAAPVSLAQQPATVGTPSRPPAIVTGTPSVSPAIVSGTPSAPRAIDNDAATGLAAGDGRVRALMFYGPTCPHCHDIIIYLLPSVEERFGDDLDLLLVNSEAPEGLPLFVAALDQHGVPPGERGVPVVFVGDEMLTGDEIFDQLGPTLEATLASGGCDWPPIPGLAGVLAENGQSSDEVVLPRDMPLRERLALDPSGNTLAISVLIAMIATLAAAVVSWPRWGPWPIAASARPVAGTAATTLRAVGWFRRLGSASASRPAVPILGVVGLVVASYLAYVEVTSTTAVCGPVGDCNAVQQSSYALLFGFLPVGVLGVIGYVVLLALWLWQRHGPAAATARTRWLLPATALFGVAFSTYLTYLEPFVIGAVCMWCVASAIVMTLLAWLSIGAAIAATPVTEAAAPAAPSLKAAAPGAAAETAPGTRKAVVEASRGRGRRILSATGYVVAAIAGFVLAAGLVRLYDVAVNPGLFMTVAQANRRVDIENAVLVAGVVLGPLAWHALRARHRRMRR